MSELTISPVLSRPFAALMKIGPAKTGRWFCRQNIAKWDRPKRMDAAYSDGQHDFPDVIRDLHQAVRRGRLGQRKCGVDDGPHATRSEQRPDVFSHRFGDLGLLRDGTRAHGRAPER